MENLTEAVNQKVKDRQLQSLWDRFEKHEELFEEKFKKFTNLIDDMDSKFLKIQHNHTQAAEKSLDDATYI